MPPTEAEIRAHKLYELKKQAVLYYQANGVPAEMEKVLNDMFFDKPDDVYGYLSECFRKLATPAKICRLKGSKKCDSRGISALEVSIFCMYKNKEELFAKILWPTEILSYEHSRQEEKDEEDAERIRFLDEALNLVNNGFCQKLAHDSFSCENVLEVDAFLRTELQQLEEEAKSAREAEATPTGEVEKGKESPKDSGSRKGKSPKGKKGGKEIVIIPDEPREELFPGCSVLGALSTASCIAGARSLEMELFEFIHRATASKDSQLKLPLPLATLMYGGKASPGKSSCVKEYMITPKPHLPLDKVLEDFSKIYRLLLKTVAAKTGPSVVVTTEVGALNAASERPEQAIDLILDVMAQLEVKEQYNLVLNLAGHEIFDYEKGKYEVITGQAKMADDLADFYADLINRYPQIIAVIDPMRKQEAESWMRLAERVSERCLIVGDRVFHRPGLQAHEELSPQFQTSGWLTRLEQRNSVSDILDCAHLMRENGRRLFLSTSASDSCDTFMVDVAVGAQFDFVKIGAPGRGERAAKFSRLLDIWEHLRERSALAEVDEEASMEFPKLAVPPAESPDADSVDVSDPASKGSAKKK